MSLINLIFPRKCFGCGEEGKYLCASCLAGAGICPDICPYCERVSIGGKTHHACVRELGLDGAISLWKYSGIMRKAILSLKYKFATDVASELAGLCVTRLKSADCGFNAVLAPIPLHWYRENWRGFNQAEEVGKLIAEGMGWKIKPDLLIRKKSTIPQAGLDAKNRSRNIHRVFSVNFHQLTNQLINESTLVLFDDVWTTGSTMKEAAGVLKRAGAKKVWGLTIAR